MIDGVVFGLHGDNCVLANFIIFFSSLFGVSSLGSLGGDKVLTSSSGRLCDPRGLSFQQVLQ